MKDAEAADIEFVRDYPVAVTRLWRAVTEPVQLIQWFGPEGVYLDSCEMDFRSTGPWTCTMFGKESGSRFKVSGQITHVSPPEEGTGTVGFTWAWHDDEDRRGPESHVSFTVEETGTGARLTLAHRDLAGAETAQGHTRGWLSTLRKLDVLLDPAAQLPR
ncbi:Aha1 domain protein [Pseudooceanicola batsensis HTCC2597]|uniref:Aha1 domain protein n=1 Tax=Pseudooceanicola batsensis (strain ATCC BAA-863 / DSM 15984 / KCTC 12145 / HTCC2597) TaxID=252305 RepID=A3TYD8_PSEBH|nr:SRPBCC domain-containing protein [Pseudooceanicola batsensis]EAQ03172.1 Aha1 domain protein [Pseudooceanicola batsensis HTCC2597]